MPSVTAFCPGHISGYFLPSIHEDPIYSGSIGAGLVISEGVRVVVKKNAVSSVEIFQTDRMGMPVRIADSSPIIMDLLDQMNLTAGIQTCCHLPISSGYGLSAAALLGSVHGLNSLYKIGMNNRECAMIAHQIEVKHRTGLGDVAACQGGGFVVRLTPGPDGDIHRMMDMQMIYALTINPLKTPSILKSPEWMKHITKAFPKSIPGTLDEFMILSRRFAEDTGLISEEVRTVLTACDAHDIPASMTMLGGGVFAIGKKAELVLKKFGDIFKFTLSPGGPMILQGERVS
jgi:pantoate kinase